MTVGLEEEVEFLRDQVYRLNSALAFYQSKFSSASKEEREGLYPPDGKAPDWLTGERQYSEKDSIPLMAISRLAHGREI